METQIIQKPKQHAGPVIWIGPVVVIVHPRLMQAISPKLDKILKQIDQENDLVEDFQLVEEKNHLN